jgi:hypothetical protein
MKGRIRRGPLRWIVLRRSLAVGAAVTGLLATGILLASDGGHDAVAPIVPDPHAQQVLDADGAIRLTPSADVHWRTFPSRSCSFPVPVGWRVVWADLDRGAGWHNEARSGAGDRLTCDVAHDPQPTASAARDASRELRAAQPAAAVSVETLVLPTGLRAPAVRYRYGPAEAERAGLRLFLAGGVQLVLDARAYDFDALQRGLLRAAGGIRSTCPPARPATTRRSACLLEPVLSP